MSARTPIPTPKGIPILGNITELAQDVPEYSLYRLADQHGPIFRLTFLNQSIVFVNSYDLANEVCDEDRFTKTVQVGLKEIRNCVHDGLFTAHYPGEANWEIAHRVLIPAFGPLMIRGMFDDMYDIASQLALKWARQGPNSAITVNEDFTRVSMDTIALCALGTRFNSFYRDEMPHFIATMRNLLQASSARAFRPSVVNKLPTSDNNKYWKDIAMLRQLAQDLVDARRQDPVDKKDLLNALILGRDPQTGQKLTNDSIVNNMITFLIAGHETTSGMLSFLFYNLLRHSHAYRKAQEEVDRVIGRRKITVEDLTKLPYITAVMRETLRLHCPVTMLVLHAHPAKNNEDPVTLGNGRYELRRDEPVAIHIGKVHRDPAVYGDDADEFKPERMLDGKFEQLPKNAWKPFGNGLRACIGRPFALQEVLIVVAMLLQNFNFTMVNPSYDLRLKQAMTLKPDGFSFRAAIRHGLDATRLTTFLNSGSDPVDAGALRRECKMDLVLGDHLKPMRIFFGSNMGTCEAFAWRLADDALRYGFKAEVTALDAARESLPRGDPVAIITASYEGQPPDNATHFFEWLKGLQGDELEGVNYAVFGCGHHDWQVTFHSIPKAIDKLVGERAGTRLCELGTADAAKSDMFTDFDSWGESVFWPAVMSKFGVQTNGTARAASGLQVQIRPGMRASALGLQLQEGQVLENRLLTAPSVPEKRMLRLKLPPDMTYQCGDYLAILPVNPPNVVRQAIRRFNLSWDSMLTVWKLTENSSGSTAVPLETPISALELFSTYVELCQPASKRDLNTLADAVNGDAAVETDLRSLASDATRFMEEIVQRRVSPIDILMRHPVIDLPLNTFLTMLPPMRVRQYSISSSPLADPSECSITFSVLKSSAPSAGSREDCDFEGVASTYLAGLQPGEKAHMTVRPSTFGFKPPLDLQTPMIMACAGSGLAPFRGFIMDRVEKIRGRQDPNDALSDAQHPDLRALAKAILYVGCRTKGLDDIHAEELAEWQRLGAVDVRWVYSRSAGDMPSNPSPHAGPDGAFGWRRHVQDQMFEDREELVGLLKRGARIFVCGGTGVGQGVRQALKRIYLAKRREGCRLDNGIDADGQDSSKATDDEDAAAERFLETLKTKERYATDVFT